MERSAPRPAAPAPRAGPWIDRLLRVPWHTTVALLVFAAFLVKGVEAEVARGVPLAYGALLALPVGLLLLRRPVALGLAMAAAGIYLRVLYVGWPEGCDQLAVSRAALDVALTGHSPWGIGYAASNPPGSPFPYGPLAMVTSVAGVPGEIVAVGGLMLLLAWQRALLTLAVLSGWYIAVEFGVCGLNDQLPASLLLAGLLLVERRRVVAGTALVAVAAGIKPYVFAWFPGLIGIGGVTALATLGVVTLLAWLPALAWGPGSFLRSVELARATHPVPENALDRPELRVLAVPLAIAALFARRWSVAVLSGALIFVVVLFLDSWASVGYWYVVIPPVGVIAERALVRLGETIRAGRARGPDPGPAQDAIHPGTWRSEGA